MVNVNFIPVDPKDVPNFHRGPTGRVSYPILKSFLESGMALVMLDRSEMTEKQRGSVGQSLSYYIKKHKLPVKLIRREGEIYLARIDSDSEGKVPDKNIDTLMEENARAMDRTTGPIVNIDDDAEVESRFE